jgi:hypothetical protein
MPLNRRNPFMPHTVTGLETPVRAQLVHDSGTTAPSAGWDRMFPEMELKMINLKILSTAAAIALVLPLVTPTDSFAQESRGGGGGRGGGAAIGGGGGGAMGGGAAIGGGGGGFRGGGGAAIGGGGGGFRGGAAMAPESGFRGGGGVASTGRSPIVAPPSAYPRESAAQPGGSRWAGGGGNWSGGRHWHGHRHRHGGFWPGVAIGAGIGSSYAYYGGGYGGGYGYGYSDPYYYDDGYYGSTVAVAPGGDDTYCRQRYKSYDPASGTYLGYDGQRHPCP